MTEHHEDPKFEAWLKDAARTTYHAPRTTPREEMWARIEAKRRHKPVIELRPWMRWALAAAAVLVFGIGIGRWSVKQVVTPVSTPVAGIDTVQPASPDQPNVVYQVAATQYLSRTEAFLTSFRADLVSGQRGGNNLRFARQARDLLSTTRLMLDSPAADDQRLRALLEDLELVLAQIAQLGAAQSGEDTDLITQGMNRSNVLPKLRSAIPAGPVPARTEGAL